MNQPEILLDPTAETSPVERERRARLPSLAGRTVALLDIGKARGDVFIDQLGQRLAERGIATRHYAKPTNTKVAPVALAQTIAAECDVVIEALSD